MEAAELMVAARFGDEIAARWESARRLQRMMRTCRRTLSQAKDEAAHLCSLIENAPDRETLKEWSIPYATQIVAQLVARAEAASAGAFLAVGHAAEDLGLETLKRGLFKSNHRRWSTTYFVRLAFSEASDADRELLNSIRTSVWMDFCAALAMVPERTARADRRPQVARWRTMIRRMYLEATRNPARQGCETPSASAARSGSAQKRTMTGGYKE